MSDHPSNQRPPLSVRAARLRDVPALAWTSARAFAPAGPIGWVLALCWYVPFWLALAQLARRRELWCGGARLVIAIRRPGSGSRRVIVRAVVLALVLIAVPAAITVATVELLPPSVLATLVQTPPAAFLLAAVPPVAGGVAVACFVSLLSLRRELKTWAAGTNALEQWQAETGLSPWIVEGLAKRPGEVPPWEGLRFADMAIARAIPSDSPYAVIARGKGHRRAYRPRLERIGDTPLMIGWTDTHAAEPETTP